MSENELNHLRELLAKVEKATRTLDYSYRICTVIGIKDRYTQEEEDRFEALTAKFARLSDLILKKVIRTICILDLEDAPPTMRDALAQAEKKGLIGNELEFIEIRKKRNEIAHEYAASEEDIQSLYESVLEKTPLLFDSVRRIIAYSERFQK